MAPRWQQDGAPVHATRPCKNFLAQSFGNRVCGNGLSAHPWNGVEWPPRSPDLSVMDFRQMLNLFSHTLKITSYTIVALTNTQLFHENN